MSGTNETGSDRPDPMSAMHRYLERRAELERRFDREDLVRRIVTIVVVIAAAAIGVWAGICGGWGGGS